MSEIARRRRLGERHTYPRHLVVFLRREESKNAQTTGRQMEKEREDGRRDGEGVYKVVVSPRRKLMCPRQAPPNKHLARHKCSRSPTPSHHCPPLLASSSPFVPASHSTSSCDTCRAVTLDALSILPPRAPACSERVEDLLARVVIITSLASCHAVAMYAASFMLSSSSPPGKTTQTHALYPASLLAS